LNELAGVYYVMFRLYNIISYIPRTQPKPVFQKPEDEEAPPSDEMEPAWKKQKI
jgi:hypothetical protein